MRGLVWTCCVLATLVPGPSQAEARTRRQAALSSRVRQALIGHLDITSDKVTRTIYDQITSPSIIVLPILNIVKHCLHVCLWYSWS